MVVTLKTILMINRELYIRQISEFINKPFVKVITGLRRSGKSSILTLLQDELIGQGVKKRQIIYINMESFNFSHLMDAEDLHQYLKGIIKKNERAYIFVDEIQEIRNWEKAINAFMTDYDADIYITGSNSRLLSSELATYLTGRYVEFRILPLSFKEFLLFHKTRGKSFENTYQAFELFLRMGGFPALHIADYSMDSAYKIVHDIYSSAILRDTIQRHNIRDVELLERVVKYVFDNIGNKFSAKNVADFFKSQQRKMDLNTVYNYLNALESAFIIYRIPRYDLKGKEILKTQEKYFVGDPGFLYAVMGYKDRLISGILENIVMLELKRRSYRVYVGKQGEKEIDFIAEKGDSRIYVQVTYKLHETSTIEREFSPLAAIPDNYPKYVVSMDPFWKENIGGVRHFYIADFLLMEEWG